MTSQVEQLKDDLLLLPLEVRASLAKVLIESLDQAEDLDTESLWIEEVRRREAALRSGKASTRSAEQVLQEAREILRCMK